MNIRRALRFSFVLNLVVASFGTAIAAEDTPQTIAQAMPGTAFTSTAPTVIDGLYEVVAGDNVLYVDRTGRYLVVGSIYDLKTDTDLSAERRAAVLQEKAAEVADGANPDDEVVAKALAGLMSARDDLAITTGQGATTLTVLTDPDCAYCRRLWTESLDDLDGVAVRHLLLDRDDRSIGILCSTDPAQALDRAYAISATTAKTPVPSAGCRRRATAKLNRVIRFVQSAGLPVATPILIREDGAVHAGYLGRSDLLNWLGEQTDET